MHKYWLQSESSYRVELIEGCNLTTYLYQGKRLVTRIRTIGITIHPET